MSQTDYFKQPTSEMLADLEARASLAGFFDFPHGDFEKIENHEKAVENWEKWVSQLNRGRATTALNMTPSAFGYLLEAIASGGLDF